MNPRYWHALPEKYHCVAGELMKADLPPHEINPMNPLPMLKAEIKSLGWTAVVIVVLVALAAAIGVAINAQERILRKNSAMAADDFDLLVGAPGSQTQLVMTTIFLQPEAVPLMEGAVLQRILADARAQGAAPIAFGDISRGHPIIGTTLAFVTRWGRIAPAEGRSFVRREEAVIGADVALGLGATIVPAHEIAGVHRQPGMESPEEAEHRHNEMTYVVVGRLPRLGTPWDRAILVPIESVWQVHGLIPEASSRAWPRAALDGERKAAVEHPPPFEDFGSSHPLPGVPAIVVRPRSIADAYGLRSAYRQAGTMAFFPAEVLVSLYGALGNVRDILLAASLFNAILIFTAVLLLLWAVASLRAKRYAILRALGAPRAFILVLVWLNAVVLLAGGCTLGLLAGWALTAVLSSYSLTATGMRLDFIFDVSDIGLAAGLVLIASVLALVPALISYRRPVVSGLRSSL
jgi:putative ABC transport system permease protein